MSSPGVARQRWPSPGLRSRGRSCTRRRRGPCPTGSPWGIAAARCCSDRGTACTCRCCTPNRAGSRSPVGRVPCASGSYPPTGSRCAAFRRRCRRSARNGRTGSLCSPRLSYTLSPWRRPCRHSTCPPCRCHPTRRCRRTRCRRCPTRRRRCRRCPTRRRTRCPRCLRRSCRRSRRSHRSRSHPRCCSRCSTMKSTPSKDNRQPPTMTSNACTQCTSPRAVAGRDTNSGPTPGRCGVPHDASAPCGNFRTDRRAGATPLVEPSKRAWTRPRWHETCGLGPASNPKADHSRRRAHASTVARAAAVALPGSHERRRSTLIAAVSSNPHAEDGEDGSRHCGRRRRCQRSTAYFRNPGRTHRCR